MLVYQRVMEMIPLMVHCGIVVYPIYGSYNYGNITIVIVVCCGKYGNSNDHIHHYLGFKMVIE
jgi:hypothetical protein